MSSFRDGAIVLFQFPQTDAQEGKLRPALILKAVPGKYDDWLVCMVSSKLNQYDEDFDSFIASDDEDFGVSGLKVPSVFRVSRLAVVDETVFVGVLGSISESRLSTIQKTIADWVMP